MGDADLPHQGMNGPPGDEEGDIEERIDDLQEHLEEQMNILYEMFHLLQQRTNSVYRQIVLSSLFVCAAGLGIPLYLRSLWDMRYANRDEAQPSPRNLYYMLMEDEGEDGDVDTEQPRTDESDFTSTSSSDTDPQPPEHNRFEGELAPPPNNVNPAARNLIAPLNNLPNLAVAEMNALMDNVLRFRENQNANLNNQNQTDRNAIPALSNLSIITRSVLPPLNNINMVEHVPQFDLAERNLTVHTERVDSIAAPPREREVVDQG